MSPQQEPPTLRSPGSEKIISFTEEVYETVETKPSSKRTRVQVDDISAPEYFTKGATCQLCLLEEFVFVVILLGQEDYLLSSYYPSAHNLVMAFIEF